MWRHFTTTTPIYSRSTLYYSSIAGQGPFSIRLRITSYRTGTETAKLGIITSLPARYENTPLYGGNRLVQGTSEMPKIQLQGHIDTPFTEIDSTGQAAELATPFVPSRVQSKILFSSNRVSYGELIALAIEGRASETNPAAIDPDYFLDPYGRVFTDPRIISFSARYIQGIPYREEFSMTLQLTKGSSS